MELELRNKVYDQIISTTGLSCLLLSCEGIDGAQRFCLILFLVSHLKLLIGL